MIVDFTAAARTPDENRIRDWLATQRIFVSSALADTQLERDEVVRAVEAEGARPVWFEELGRDANAQEAYTAGVDTSSVYIAVLNELYGNMGSSGFSATETEYNRARERGHRIAVFTSADAPLREGHLRQFIGRLQVFITTESYADPGDVGRRVGRRLRELAAEALSPWVKLDELVFRADEIIDRGAEISFTARTNDDIVYRLESLRDQTYSRSRVRFVYGDRVVDADVGGVERTVRFGGAADVAVTLTRAASARHGGGGYGRVSTGGMTPDDLVEVGLRELFFGDPQPASVQLMGLTRTGIDEGDVEQAFRLSNEIVAPVTRLIVAEGLIASGNAMRILDLQASPLVGDARNLRLAWEPPTQYGAASTRREIDGGWTLR